MRVKIFQPRPIYACCAVGILVVIAMVLGLHRPHVPREIRKPTANYQSPLRSLGPRTPVLNVESITPYGHIVEIQAETDPGTTVMVNGEKAAVIFAGSRIRHFVGPLPDGITVVTITAQNDEGGVITKRLAVLVP
jgi:hypothetical protein